MCNIIFMFKVDCSNCLMVQQKKFSKELKCCSFLPFRPNFLSHIGADWVSENYIKTRLGLVPNSSYVQEFNQSIYGNNKNLKCDYFKQGICQIWENRPSVCRTYFCTNSNNMVYKNDHYQQLESSLSQAVLFEMGYTLKEVKSEIEFYNKLIDASFSVCYPFQVDFEFYKECNRVYKSIKDWEPWIGEQYCKIKLQWENL